MKTRFLDGKATCKTIQNTIRYVFMYIWSTWRRMKIPARLVTAHFPFPTPESLIWPSRLPSLWFVWRNFHFVKCGKFTSSLAARAHVLSVRNALRVLAVIWILGAAPPAVTGGFSKFFCRSSRLQCYWTLASRRLWHERISCSANANKCEGAHRLWAAEVQE